MFPLAREDEVCFRSTVELADHLRKRRMAECSLPLARVSAAPDGELRLGSAVARVTEGALASLLCRLGIPWDYADRVCDAVLLADSINRLARNHSEKVTFHVVEGKVVGLTDPRRIPLSSSLIIEYCKSELATAREITLAGPFLRIAATERTAHEVLPGDTFEYGWELTNCDAGTSPLDLRRYSLRLVCSNGAIARQGRGGFRRMPSKSLDAIKVLDCVRERLRSREEVGSLEAGIRRAREAKVGTDLPSLRAGLTRLFGEDAYASRFRDLTPDADWYEIYNRLTSAARMYSLRGRRNLEALGGDLIDWFASGDHGRGKKWRGLKGTRCLRCPLRSHPPQGDTQDNGRRATDGPS